MRTSRHLSSILWFLAAASPAACSREREPAASAVATDTVAVAEAAPPPPTLSRFSVPLRYDFTQVLAVVERVVPKTFGSLDSVHTVGTDTRKHYAFVATRDTFTAFASGSKVHLRTTLSYEARGYYKPLIGPTLGAGCGNSKERPQIVIELITPLTLTGNWHLQSKAVLAGLTPASDSAKDRCNVSILNYDVTERVINAAQQALTAHLSDIDAKIAAIDLTSRAKGWWELLNRPIPLAPDVWLLLQPERLRLGEVTGEEHVLLVRAGLDAYPKIVTGSEPHPVVSPLPLLAPDTSQTGFRILLEGNIDYATASHLLTEALSGKTVTEAGQTIVVQSVTASPDVAGRLALAVAFTGAAKGTLRFVGTPRYDTAQAKIGVPDLDYDLKTDNTLLGAYSWLRSDVLRAGFRRKAQLPVTPVLERGRAMLVSGLNRTIGGAMRLSATVDSVAVVGLYVTAPGLMVRASASGNARVSVRQKR